jgi:hypothetical protein
LIKWSFKLVIFEGGSVVQVTQAAEPVHGRGRALRTSAEKCQTLRKVLPREIKSTPLTSMLSNIIYHPDKMNSYTYEPLDLAVREIRLIEIQPSAQFSSQVKCKIIKTRLEDAPEYLALSYCWGDQTNPICIRLDGHLFPVGINLYLALRRLRGKSIILRLWVDAVYIDQANTHERGHQVSMMRAIYEGALSVVVWLGEEASGSALAMGLIRLGMSLNKL